MSLFEDYSISKARIELREEKRFYGLDERKQVTSLDDVCDLLWEETYRAAACEVFTVCLLNTANVVQVVVKTSGGGLSGTVVNPRDVYQPALLRNASAVICAHNHPSGNPEPSREDMKMTQALEDAGEVLGILLHDHPHHPWPGLLAADERPRLQDVRDYKALFAGYCPLRSAAQKRPVDSSCRGPELMFLR